VKKVSLSEIRDLLSATGGALGSSDLNSRQIIATFRAEHEHQIDSALDELVDIALIKLLNDVSRRRPTPTVSSGSGDLFSHYNVPALVAVPATIAAGKREYKRRSFPSLTYGEAVDWLDAHTKEREESHARYEGARALIERVTPFVTSPTMTMQEAVALANAAERKKAKVS
jgi:hypothetical protein